MKLPVSSECMIVLAKPQMGDITLVSEWFKWEFLYGITHMVTAYSGW